MAKTPTNAPGMEIGRRISPKEMGYDKETLLKLVLSNTAVEHALYRVVGIATSLKPYKDKTENGNGETKFGLMGQFEATSVDGEIKTGSSLYLPTYVNDMIVAALSMEGTEAVRLAFDVYVKYEKDAATSYTYIARDLLNAGSQSVDEIKAEISSLPAMPKTLALPSE